MSKKSGAGKFVFGAAIGALAGLLFAPKTGKELRKDISDKASELLEKVKDIDAEDVKNTIEDKTSEIVAQIKSLDKEKVLKIAKEKSKELKKSAEELVAYTKEKATPVATEAAKELKEKAISATKKILEKLEETEK